MATDIKSFTKPQEIAEAGERIYLTQYKENFERQYSGHFVAIDVLSEKAYVGEFPEQALEKARTDAPSGLFHLIKIGSAGAFRVTFASHADSNWAF